MPTGTDHPQIDPNENQRKIIMKKVLEAAGPDLIFGRFMPLDIDMAIRQVVIGTKYDFVPKSDE